MDSAALQNLRNTFERLIAAPEPERAAILDQVSQHDAALAGELKRMVAAHDKLTSVLDHPIATFSVPVRHGSHIGPYRIEKELGNGGMGVVYLATRADGSFQRKAAIKILRNDRIDDLFLNRFQQERQILAQLNHPHIAAILDAILTSSWSTSMASPLLSIVRITRCQRTVDSISSCRFAMPFNTPIAI